MQEYIHISLVWRKYDVNYQTNYTILVESVDYTILCKKMMLITQTEKVSFF